MQAVAFALVAAAGGQDGVWRPCYDSAGLHGALAARSARPQPDRSLVWRAVESLFGTMKGSYRLGRIRRFTQARNRAYPKVFAIAFNMRRWRSLFSP